MGSSVIQVLEGAENSPLANEAGFVDVDDFSTQHRKYANVWSLGDASSLPTSKTAAAITAEAPVLVKNLLRAMDGEDAAARYEGYTSCPLLTGEGKVMLAEFKYGGVPDETFKRYEKDPRWVKWAPGGYEKEEWYRRALVDAFAGLGVFVEEEMDTSQSTAMEGITT